MRNLPQVSCSLNLGLIYSLDYSYSPSNGTSIKLYFVNQNGIYPTNPLPMQKAFIQIGGASFSMYPVAGEVELSAGRRVMWVEFVDEFYQLKKYYIALPGRGCGTNIFTIGTQVDNRTDQQKIAAALDKTAQQIKTLTQFPDYEYSFNDFIIVLRSKFNVQVNASFNSSITQAFEGSFDNVLSSWCSYYNLSFFFENGVIKIFDPSRLTITLPTKPSDALSYNNGWDNRSTYGRTICNWFQQDGGEYPLSQTSNTSGPALVRSAMLYPVGYELGLQSYMPDLKQVAAAMFGQNYWFLYNYYNGSMIDECGFTPIQNSQTTIPSSLASVISVASLQPPGNIAIFDQQKFTQRFEMYQQYGQSIAGRWYLSNAKSDLAIDQKFSWFDESGGPILDFTNVDSLSINPTYLTPITDGSNFIPETVINQYYPGVNYIGNRIAYKDNYDANLTGVFNLGALQGLVDTTYQALTSLPGSTSFDFSDIYPYITTPNILLGYTLIQPSQIPQDISNTFASLSDLSAKFNPRFSSFPIKGISSNDYSALKSAQSEPNGVSIVNASSGPTVVTNTSVIKTLQQGSYTIYYDKYSKCASASTPDLYFNYQFDARQISNDNQIGIAFQKQSNNSYKLTRDYGLINSLVNNPLLPTLAQARTFPTKQVSFTLNYFYNVPINFLSNGLVGMTMTIGDNGVLASYSFSNEVLQVPNLANNIAVYNKLAQNMKNSWLRIYRPTETLS